MIVEFIDRQEEFNPLNGAEITTSAELSSIIDDLRERSPFFFELIGENGHKLLVGVGESVGCSQYSSVDGNAPYLMATTGSEFNIGDCVVFLIGDAPTPVPRYYCLPIETIKQIASYFVETGERSTIVRWERIKSTAH